MSASLKGSLIYCLKPLSKPMLMPIWKLLHPSCLVRELQASSHDAKFWISLYIQTSLFTISTLRYFFCVCVVPRAFGKSRIFRTKKMLHMERSREICDQVEFRSALSEYVINIWEICCSAQFFPFARISPDLLKENNVLNSPVFVWNDTLLIAVFVQ